MLIGKHLKEYKLSRIFKSPFCDMFSLQMLLYSSDKLWICIQVIAIKRELPNHVKSFLRKKGRVYFTWGDNFFHNSINTTPIFLIFWYVSTNWGSQRISIIKNCLQGACGHVHIGHGEAHHVGVGVVQIQKCTNSFRA